MDYKSLLKKYDVPVPRYTSYPTVPFWSDSPSAEQWEASLHQALAREHASWSMYLHIPFCETLCTFCGCNTVITRSHEREAPYLQALTQELATYLQRVPEFKTKPLRQLHLGGGTPTFVSPENLKRYLSEWLQELTVDSDHFEASVEVDPRRTSKEHLQVLHNLGFSRVSMGVQDFDPEVQRLVNRVQPLEQTKDLTVVAREMGYTSVNFDLIYGLPKQTLASFQKTISQTIALLPDRIALYSFALVPWIKPQQRLFKDEDLPQGAEKRALYEAAYVQLIAAGYVEIGMDHFALRTDALYLAQKSRTLHRNFMGYTEMRTDVLLGFGVSSISETPDCFHQNEKVLPVYERRTLANEIPTFRGHRLSKEDQFRRQQILHFMTEGQVKLTNPEQEADVKSFLQDMIQDGLVEVVNHMFQITSLGRPFLRNACVALDQRLRLQRPDTKVFSQAL